MLEMQNSERRKAPYENLTILKLRNVQKKRKAFSMFK